MKIKKSFRIVSAFLLTAAILSGCGVSSDNVSQIEEKSQIEQSAVDENDENSIIASFKSGDISEKEMFDKLYSLEEYTSGGHVITNIDIDSNYELVTRSKDKKTIDIYELFDNRLEKVVTLSADIQANLLYVDENTGDEKFEHSCYFETIDYAENNNMKVRIYRYRNDSGVLVTQNEYLVELYGDSKMDYVKIMDKDGNKLEGNDAVSAHNFLTSRWQESFNDNCFEIVPISQNSDVIKLSESNYVGPSGPAEYYAYTLDYNKLISDFCNAYYNDGDHPKFVTFGLYINGLSEIDAHTLAKHEITARYNLSYDDPLITAFMNKKPYYNADPSLTIEQVNNLFNEHERFNYENYPNH